MVVSTFITLLTTFTALTSLVVQKTKDILDEKKKEYSSNMLAVIEGCIIGILGTLGYYLCTGLPFNAINIVAMIIMGPLVALSSMGLYDKVIQTMNQLFKK